jgi:hypothetical protein
MASTSAQLLRGLAAWLAVTTASYNLRFYLPRPQINTYFSFSESQGAPALKSEKSDPAEGDGPKQETARDDRFSHWNDQRYQSKHLRGWRGDLIFEVKQFYWPLLKRSFRVYFGPWPIAAMFLVFAALYLVISKLGK